MVPDDPEAIAQWLLTTPELHKDMIGITLSDPSRDDIRQAFGRAVMTEESFKGAGFTVALRQYLATFKMPGEAAQIERILETFAQRYFELNADIAEFANEDVAHILSFSVIMLNTDAHNPGLLLA